MANVKQNVMNQLATNAVLLIMLLVFNVLQDTSLIILILHANYVMMLLDADHALLQIHLNVFLACMGTILLLTISAKHVLLIANLALMPLSALCLIATKDKFLCLMPMENLSLDNAIKDVGVALVSTLDLVVSAGLDILLSLVQPTICLIVFLARQIA